MKGISNYRLADVLKDSGVPITRVADLGRTTSGGENGFTNGKYIRMLGENPTSADIMHEILHTLGVEHYDGTVMNPVSKGFKNVSTEIFADMLRAIGLTVNGTTGKKISGVKTDGDYILPNNGKVYSAKEANRILLKQDE